MQKLLTAEQFRQADAQTIANEPIASVDLMERASNAFVSLFSRSCPDIKTPISVYCGTGNNGGDGLAIARMLYAKGYEKLEVKVVRFSERETQEFKINLSRLSETRVPVLEIRESDPLPVEDAEVIIDALLGSGLNKPLEGAWKELVIWLRSLSRKIISVDIPTGFKADGVIGKKDIAIRSELTITFQRPKINFLLPESASFIQDFAVADIGLDETFLTSVDTPFELLTENDIRTRLKKRAPFSHKGTYGHALIIAGAPETMGAALICAHACLKAGAGLTTACIPASGLTALNCSLPEVMAQLRAEGELPAGMDWEKYSSIAIGPGLGTSAAAKLVLEETLNRYTKPLVLDADALNLLAKEPHLLNLLPRSSILTPHMKEFDRLFGEHQSWWERLETGRAKAADLNCYIVLKNRFTIICTPAGKSIFSPTGTPAMASGGMGDALTGIIASFLAQSYPPEDAAILGVYLHGLAGEKIGRKAYSVTASEVIDQVPIVADEVLNN